MSNLIKNINSWGFAERGVDGGGWGDLIGFRDWCRLDIEKTDNLKKTPSNYPRRS